MIDGWHANVVRVRIYILLLPRSTRHSVRQAGRSAREAMDRDSKLLRIALVSCRTRARRTVSCGRRGGFHGFSVCRPAAPARLCWCWMSRKNHELPVVFHSRALVVKVSFSSPSRACSRAGQVNPGHISASRAPHDRSIAGGQLHQIVPGQPVSTVTGFCVTQAYSISILRMGRLRRRRCTYTCGYA